MEMIDINEEAEEYGFKTNDGLQSVLLEDAFIAGYKAATKVYSEVFDFLERNDFLSDDRKVLEKQFLASLKQSKPKWFVAEMEQVVLKDPNSCEHYIEVGCIKDICTCYTFRLKTITINNKIYLVGKYSDKQL